MQQPNILKSTLYLIQKELLLEWRQKYAIGGILLYVCSTVFIVFIAGGEEIEPKLWNSLFWIVVLFASVNAVVKSFVQENTGQMIYYYTLFPPIAVILSKMFYNIILLSILCLLTYAAFSLFINNPVIDYERFFLALLLGSSGFSIVLTFVSAIASKANNSATMLAILGFPVIIPVLLTVIALTKTALQSKLILSSNAGISILIAVDLVMLGMGLLLFPYLWRD